jgi:sigma-B regulation protein RsbU (phosphoserine phosphatase)
VYANTGHPHAFIVSETGFIERLAATDPPLGMVDSPPSAVTRPWKVSKDLLLLFTDGVSDARNRLDVRLGEQAVLDTVRRHRADRCEFILERVLGVLDQHVGEALRRDDLTLVVLRS